MCIWSILYNYIGTRVEGHCNAVGKMKLISFYTKFTIIIVGIWSQQHAARMVLLNSNRTLLFLQALPIADVERILEINQVDPNNIICCMHGSLEQQRNTAFFRHSLLQV